MPQPEVPSEKTYRLKLALVGFTLVILGLALNLLSTRLSGQHANDLLVGFVHAISSAVLFTGALGVALDWFAGREREEKDEARQRRILKEMTPNYIDAVLRA